MIETRVTTTTYVIRAILYALLIAFAFLMIFPFLYMMSTSFKNSKDVFHFPPRLFPYSPVTLEQNGEKKELYTFLINGTPRDLVLTGERVQFAFYTTQDKIKPDNARESEIVVRLPRDSADATATGNTITLKDSQGREQKFEEFRVNYDGKEEVLLQAYRGALDKFVDPNDPNVVMYASARTAQQQEKVEFQTGNYNAVFGLNLDRALVNTTLVTLGVTIGQLVTSIFGGYAFSRVNFKGRDTLFVAYLGSIMIPFVVLIIPLYRLMVAIDWQNRLVSLIVPWIFTAYGTFLMRQFFMSIPKELEEAALLDGTSRFGILWRIFVPLSTPAIATLGIFSFLYAWNSFLWPLLIIGEGNTPNHVLTLSLIRLSNAYADQPNLVLTGAAVAILPPIIVFILAQRYFIEGVAASGMK